MRYLNDVDEETFTKAVKESNSKSEVARRLGIDFYNGDITKDINELLKTHKVSTNHFQLNKHNIKFQIIEKSCPVCGKKFETKAGYKKEKQTCSYACSNTLFRSGKSNGNFICGESSYKKICFRNFERKCLICDERKVLDTHHLDGNRKNNSIDNLIPLCPTHHRYMHSPYKSEIENIILDKIKELKNK